MRHHMIKSTTCIYGDFLLYHTIMFYCIKWFVYERRHEEKWHLWTRTTQLNLRIHVTWPEPLAMQLRPDVSVGWQQRL